MTVDIVVPLNSVARLAQEGAIIRDNSCKWIFSIVACGLGQHYAALHHVLVKVAVRFKHFLRPPYQVWEVDRFNREAIFEPWQARAIDSNQMSFHPGVYRMLSKESRP